jgi:tRNA (guanine-N7-)-methyltransferase
MNLKSYVLRQGRMTAAQMRSYETLSPLYCIPYNPGLELSCPALFANDRPLTVEIGFGMGQATASLAEMNPEKNYLGIEVFKSGVGKLLWEIERRNIENIRIIEHDAIETVEHMLANESVEAFHIFFPDPWPKKKHHKRRLVARPFTDMLAEKLLPGGYISMATDWSEYAEEALNELSATPGLEGGLARRQDWRPETKFERKGLENERQTWDLYFVKVKK